MDVKESDNKDDVIQDTRLLTIPKDLYYQRLNNVLTFQIVEKDFNLFGVC